MSTDPLDALLEGDVWEVAEHLLGWVLESSIGGKRTAVALTETEAYAGDLDPASHAYRGPTERNRSMYGPPGTLYVYRSYGIHWCMNVVVGREGLPHAVLLRGGEPRHGEEVMAQRRGRDRDLTNGPGRLCQALGVTGVLDGADLRRPPLQLLPGTGLGSRRVYRTPRVGLSKAKDRPWRFVVDG